jgi:hypothetical protein
VEVVDENYLMNFDEETGKIKGFYLRSVHGIAIPTPCIEISPADHALIIHNNGRYKLNVETKTLEELSEPEVELESYGPTLDDKNRADIDYLAIMMGVDL